MLSVIIVGGWVVSFFETQCRFICCCLFENKVDKKME